MTYHLDWDNLSAAELRDKLSEVKSEVQRLENVLAKKEMLDYVTKIDNDPSIPCVRPCGGNCQMCEVLYSGPIISNKKNPNDPIVFTDATLTCKSFKEGNYGIIDTKESCPFFGVVYMGQSQDMVRRCNDYKAKIRTGDLNNGDPRSIHRHFLNHDDKDENGKLDPLKHFRFVPIQEVKGGTFEREKEEVKLMLRFGTFGPYGFNDSKPRIYNKFKVHEQMMDKVPVTASTAGGYKGKDFGDVRKRLWVGLALLNTPELKGDAAHIRNFMDQNFSMTSVESRSLMLTLHDYMKPTYIDKDYEGEEQDDNVEPKPPTKCFTKTNISKGTIPRYIFGFNSGCEQTLLDEIASERYTFRKLFKNPEFLEGDEEKFEELMDGNLVTPKKSRQTF